MDSFFMTRLQDMVEAEREDPANALELFDKLWRFNGSSTFFKHTLVLFPNCQR
jgi:hypothetical protein